MRYRSITLWFFLAVALLSTACSRAATVSDRPVAAPTVQSPATPTSPVALTPWASKACDPPVGPVKFDGPHDETVSKRMQEIIDADQNPRRAAIGGTATPDLNALEREDRERRMEVMGYLGEGKLNTGTDLFYAALIFQHGTCAEHFKFANLLAEKALEKGNFTMMGGEQSARWLYAATLDRYLLSQGQPQKFGTQYDCVQGEWQLLPVDPSTSDAERQKYNVPTLAEAQEQAKQIQGQCQ